MKKNAVKLLLKIYSNSHYCKNAPFSVNLQTFFDAQAAPVLITVKNDRIFLTVLYNEETSDDFDWSIGSGSSRISNTGPSTDSKGSIYGINVD